MGIEIHGGDISEIGSYTPASPGDQLWVGETRKNKLSRMAGEIEGEILGGVERGILGTWDPFPVGVTIAEVRSVCEGGNEGNLIGPLIGKRLDEAGAEEMEKFELSGLREEGDRDEKIKGGEKVKKTLRTRKLFVVFRGKIQ